MKTTKLLLLFLSGFAALGLQAQNLTVKGTITDGATGDPVPFASVVVKGTGAWTTSDAEGHYTVEAPATATLSVESLGYVSAAVAVDGKTALDITLYPDLDQLSEAVVIGYGVQQKKLLTGSTVQVKGGDLTKLSTTSVLGALQSQSPGVTITQASGQPGEGYKVNIRGMGTIGDSDPLYVIDGVAGGSLSALNPADIESIDVLKDAASAAIYGARAANGVVLVTTKQGKEGRAVVSYDGYYGWQFISKMPNLCNAQEYMAALDLMYKNEGIALTNWSAVLPAKLYQSIQNGSWKGTNWMEEAYNKGAMTQNHAINVTGGTADHKYAIGLSYTAQDGIIGYNKRVWTVDETTDNSVTFGWFSPDGEENFPGNLKVTCKYTLTEDNELKLEYKGKSDADTILNMTNHAYYNIGGIHSGSVLSQIVQINSES